MIPPRRWSFVSFHMQCPALLRTAACREFVTVLKAPSPGYVGSFFLPGGTGSASAEGQGLNGNGFSSLLKVRNRMV